MKKLITDNITSTVAMPIKAGTLDHLQEAYQEIAKAICRSIGTNDDTGGSAATDILYGLENTGSGSTYTISRGAIYTGGEIYLAPNTASFTVSGGDTAVVCLVTAYRTATDADPVQHTDGNNYNVHAIRTVEVKAGTSSTAGYLGDYSSFVSLKAPEAWKTVGAVGQPAYGANYSAGPGYAKFRRDRVGMVTLEMAVSAGVSAAALQTIFTLPAGYRPAFNITFPCEIYDTGSTYYPGRISITTAGVVSVSNLYGATLASRQILASIQFYNT